MKFLLLIYGNEANDPNPADTSTRSMSAGYVAFQAEATSNGVLVAGDRLLPTRTARTVRVRGGKSLVTDGPFAETSEQLGGYYLLDCKDEAEAVAYALKVPAAATACVEVRRIMEM